MQEMRWSLRACGGAAVLGVLICLLVTATPADAKFKVRLRSTPKSAPAPSAPTPCLPASGPDGPKGAGKVEAGRQARPDVHVNVRSRGFFDRVLDWLFWRRPGPGAPAPVSPVAQAPAQRPPVAVPGPAAVPAVAQAPGPVLPIVLFVPPPRAPRRPNRQEAIARGYVIHLKNGNRIPVPIYEDTGDEVVIVQYGGSYGLSKSLIARIEEVSDDGRQTVGNPRALSEPPPREFGTDRASSRPPARSGRLDQRRRAVSPPATRSSAPLPHPLSSPIR